MQTIGENESQDRWNSDQLLMFVSNISNLIRRAQMCWGFSVFDNINTLGMSIVGSCTDVHTQLK